MTFEPMGRLSAPMKKRLITVLIQIAQGTTTPPTKSRTVFVTSAVQITFPKAIPLAPWKQQTNISVGTASRPRTRMLTERFTTQVTSMT